MLQTVVCPRSTLVPKQIHCKVWLEMLLIMNFLHNIWSGIAQSRDRCYWGFSQCDILQCLGIYLNAHKGKTAPKRQVREVPWPVFKYNPGIYMKKSSIHLHTVSVTVYYAIKLKTTAENMFVWFLYINIVCLNLWSGGGASTLDGGEWSASLCVGRCLMVPWSPPSSRSYQMSRKILVPEVNSE